MWSHINLEFSIFGVFAGIEPVTLGLTVPRYSENPFVEIASFSEWLREDALRH
jgi:hypothetical protein